MAVIATTDNVSKLEHDRRVAESRATQLRGEAEKLAAEIAKAKLTSSPMKKKVAAVSAGIYKDTACLDRIQPDVVALEAFKAIE